MIKIANSGNNYMKRLFVLLPACMMLALGAQNAMPIPDTLSGTNLNLNLQKGSVQFYPGSATATMGANGNLLGSTLILNRHQNVTINVKNSLGEPTTLHWHGMHVSPRNDGGPHVVVDSGTTWSPSFEVLDHASTHWYHPHLHMKTNEHVQKGIAGFIIVRDTTEAKIRLPRTYGVDDFPVVVQTKVFDANNQIVTGTNAMDTALLVNGARNVYLDVPAQVVRLRLLNGSSERAYNFGLTDNRSFYQIGSDGGLLTAPVTLTRLLLAPGERAEILINLSGLNGGNLNLMNYGSEIANGIYGARQPGMGAGQTIPNYTLNPLNGKDFAIMNLRVKPATASPVTAIPTSLITHSPWQASQAAITRNLTFTSMNMGPGAINGPFVINGVHFDMNVINYRVPFNNIEIWELRNQTPIAHPFHIHNVPFYVLTINGVAPPPSQQGRKDVILVPGGNSVVRFITRFEDFYDDTFPYMYHCHMLTHEDDGMMGQFIVEPPCDYIKNQPVSKTVDPGDPVKFSVQVADTTGLKYQWQSNIGFGFQDLQNAGQYSGVTTSELTVSNATLSNNNQLFRCRVWKGTCEQMTEVVAIYISTLNRRTLRGGDAVQVYPNPSEGTFVLKHAESMAGADFVLTDATGRVILKGKLGREDETLDLGKALPGLYLLQLQGEAGQQSAVLMKR